LGTLAVLLIGGCGTNSKSAGQSSGGQTSKIFKLRGEVMVIDAAEGWITVRHEAIPGYMGAMTMPYKLKDAAKSRELHVGDIITADVLVPADGNTEALLDHVAVVAQSRPHGAAQSSAAGSK
jgi:protein SCO1/2